MALQIFVNDYFILHCDKNVRFEVMWAKTVGSDFFCVCNFKGFDPFLQNMKVSENLINRKKLISMLLTILKHSSMAYAPE